MYQGSVTIDYSELTGEPLPGMLLRPQVVAKCSSDACSAAVLAEKKRMGKFTNNTKTNNLYTNYAVKNVSKTAVLCPDCGHALYWEKVFGGPI